MPRLSTDPSTPGNLARSRGRLGGPGGTSLVAGVRWSFRGKDAGSVRMRSYTGATEDAASGRAARPSGSALFRQALLSGSRTRVAPDEGVRELLLEPGDLDPVPLELVLLRSRRAQALALGAAVADLRLERFDRPRGGLRRNGNEWPQLAHRFSVHRFGR